MKRSNEQSIGDVMNYLIDSYGLRSKLNETKLINKWESIVGKMIARHTISLTLRNKKLYLGIDSAALKAELTYSKTKLKDLLNSEIGEDIIKEIIIK